MNDWYMDAFDWFIFDNSIVPAFQFIFTTIRQLFSAIFKERFIFIPLFLILLLSMLGFVGWLIMESAQYVGGSNYANPNRQFGKMANPNRQYETKMPLWSAIGRHAIWKHNQDKLRKEREDALADEAYHKIVEEQEALENKHRIHEMNQMKANAYFKNNPNKFKISIDGETFWRDGWENVDWRHIADNSMRVSKTYKRVGRKYKLVGESYHSTSFDSNPSFITLEKPMYRLSRGSRFIDPKISVQVDDDE